VLRLAWYIRPIRFENSTRNRIGRPIRFEIRFERKKMICRSLWQQLSSRCLLLAAVSQWLSCWPYFVPNPSITQSVSFSPTLAKSWLGHGGIETGKKGKGKGFPNSILSVVPGPDPGVQAVSPQVIHPAVGCHYFLPGLQLPSQPQSITALWPAPSYTAW